MEKYKIVFLIKDNDKWKTLIRHINVLLKSPDKIESVSVVIINTAILLCLKDTAVEDIKMAVSDAREKGVEFRLCHNTLTRYNISPDDILPDIGIAYDGGIIEVAKYISEGYYHFDI